MCRLFGDLKVNLTETETLSFKIIVGFLNKILYYSFHIFTEIKNHYSTSLITISFNYSSEKFTIHSNEICDLYYGR